MSKISIIIIVKNDKGISNTLVALESQTKPAPTEVIVVDASDPQYLENIKIKYPYINWYQYVPKNENKASIPEQRNLGIQMASGSVIVFIDANCVPDKDWLIKLTAPILDGSEFITAGSVRASNPNVRVNLNPITTKSDYLTESPTINLAFGKNIWQQVGGFDESFSFGSDVDFTWRAGYAGYKIRFIREATVTHDWGSLSDEIKRSFKYGKARAKLLEKHPDRWLKFDENTPMLLFYTLWMVGLLSSFFFWWYPFTILIVMLRNINDKPVKTVGIHLVETLGFLKGFFVGYA